MTLRPLEKTLEDVETQTIRHPYFMRALNKIFTMLSFKRGKRVIVLIGPSGCGKSSLIVKLIELLTSPEQRAAGVAPYVVTVEAPTPEHRPFRFRPLYIDILKALRDPTVEEKIHTRPGPSPGYWDSKASSYGSRRESPDILKQVVEDAIRMLGVSILIIDEAQHILKVTSARQLIDHLDVIKSIANRTGIKIVLCAHYEFSAVNNLNSQLIRRLKKIHFKRYNKRIASQYQKFVNTIDTYQGMLATAIDFNLIEHTEYLYEGTLGCVGELCDWIIRALEEAISSGSSKLRMKHFESTIRTEVELLTMARDIEAGELAMRGQLSKRSRKNKDPTPSPTGKKGRPGFRKPSRDVVEPL